MNIAYVVKRFPKISETFVLREIEEVIRQGEAVHVCALQQPHPGEPRHDGADVLAARALYVPEAPARHRALLRASVCVLARRPVRASRAGAWAVRWSVRERRLSHLRRFGEAAWLDAHLAGPVDHVHAHFAHGPASVALLLARLRGVPFSFTGHARDIFEHASPAILAAKIARARFAVAISEHTRAHLAGLARPADCDKVVVVRNGIDRDHFPARAAEPAGRPLLLAVSRLVEKKGIDTLVDACALMRGRGIDFRCEVVGDGPLREELTLRARAAGLNGEFALLGGRSHDAVRDALHRATLFVLPARETSSGDRDGLPVAIVEAMTVGVPVVSTAVSAIPEVVTHGHTGVLVPSDDPRALADAVERLLANDSTRERIAAGGRDIAARYDLTATVARLRHFFHHGPDA